MKLSKLLYKSIFLISLVAMLIALLISIFIQYNGFEKDKEYITNEFINSKKELIKTEVDKVFEYIDFKKSLVEEDTKRILKERVDLAYTTAISIYNDNKGKKSDDEIKYLIVSALKNIYFGNKRAYYFINSNSGRAILFNTKSKLNENHNVWNLKNSAGVYFVQEQAKIAKDKGEGFLKNYFVKPDKYDEIQYPKLSYVKMFEPYDWHIGTGEYLDDMEKDTQDEILKRVASIRFNKEGYVYINTIYGYSLIYDGKKLDTPLDRRDKELLQKIIKLAQSEKDGAFINYKFKKLNSNEVFDKIAFVKLYKGWDWVIGAGVYIDEINDEINRKRDELQKNITNEVIALIFLFFILIIVIYIISKNTTTFINKNIDYLTTSFDKASKDYVEVDKEKLTFIEFRSLCDSLNKTLKDRNEFENKLKETNNLLEKRIEEEILKRLDKERLLSQQSKMALMGEMLGAIAHQWRQPLNALAINIQNIDEVYYDGEIDQKYIDNLIETSMKQINFMSKTIDDFRDFFKKDKCIEQFSINQALNDAISILSSQLKVHNINYIIHSNKEYHIKAISNEFKQAMLNIVNNAKDAIMERQEREQIIGSIDIFINEDDKFLYIKICDNGNGVDEHIIDRIFEPYFTTKLNKKGTGIGLYMTKLIIEDSLKGSINLYNKDNEKGVCFSISLPKVILKDKID